MNEQMARRAYLMEQYELCRELDEERPDNGRAGLNLTSATRGWPRDVKGCQYDTSRGHAVPAVVCTLFPPFSPA